MTEKRAYYGSSDGDPFYHDDADECAQEYIDCTNEPADGETFTIYAGEGAPENGSWYMENVAEGMTNGACSELSEGAEDWCYDIEKIGDEIQAACEKAVDEILDKRNLQPQFCTLKSLPELTYRRVGDDAVRVTEEQKRDN